jgi:hypothetical protein
MASLEKLNEDVIILKVEYTNMQKEMQKTFETVQITLVDLKKTQQQMEHKLYWILGGLGSFGIFIEIAKLMYNK